MPYRFLNIAITPGVKAVQEANGVSRNRPDNLATGEPQRFTPNEAQFIAERDSFYPKPAGPMCSIAAVPGDFCACSTTALSSLPIFAATGNISALEMPRPTVAPRCF
jgi:hypothetical protein